MQREYYNPKTESSQVGLAPDCRRSFWQHFSGASPRSLRSKLKWRGRAWFNEVRLVIFRANKGSSLVYSPANRELFDPDKNEENFEKVLRIYYSAPFWGIRMFGAILSSPMTNSSLTGGRTGGSVVGRCGDRIRSGLSCRFVGGLGGGVRGAGGCAGLGGYGRPVDV